MKAVLEFDLPEEKEEYELATNGQGYYCALFDMVNCFRSKLKYEELDKKTYTIIEQMSRKFYEILDDNGVKL